MMKRVCLFNLEQVGIIYRDGSEVSFFNRVGALLRCGGGVETSLEQKGVLVPISNDAPAGFASLLDLLSELQSRASSPSMADFNGVLAQISSSDTVAVDMSRFDESRWGWVYLNVIPGGEFSQFEGFKDGKAVMTWPIISVTQ